MNVPKSQTDLGYTVVQAVQDDSKFYHFNNIRYAEPPLGELRFAAPVAAQTVNRTVNDGSQSVVCPQAYPGWLARLEGLNTAVDPRTSEDCLFLDVVVDQGAFNARQKKGTMPVLVWIYGGGYVLGDKSISAMASGLLTTAKNSTEGTITGGKSPKGMIFVAMNYRLGIFGWLSGSTFQSNNGTSNAGLYDQRLALKWIQDNIHLFGGDPNNVTVMGESAGAGCIEHQITAYGGNAPDATPFQRAILQSPGFTPTASDDVQENIFQTFLNMANASNIEEARSLSTEQLQSVNQAMVKDAPYGSFIFNPVVDGSFVPDLPGKLLLQGSFEKNLSLMLAHNSNEGALFTNPNLTSNTDFSNAIHNFFPTISSEIFDYISQDLYPPIFDDTTGKYPYTNNYERTKLLVAEVIFTCNTNYLARAYNNQTYNYIFSVSPGLHGQDIPYTFYVPNSNSTDMITGKPINETVAIALQDYITSFATTGNPNVGSRGEEEGPDPLFLMYGAGGRAWNLSGEGIGMVVDYEADNERCLWWQEGLYS